MKILHLTHTDLRYDNRILKEIEALGEVPNYQITALGVMMEEGATHANRILKADIKNIELFSSKTKCLPRAIAYFFVLFETTIRFLWISFRVKPDIVHSHDTMVLPVGWMIKLLFGSKLIYDAHELESDKNGQSKALSKATLFLERICWKKIDYLISVSDSIINWYHQNLGLKPATLILNSPMIDKNFKLSSDKYFHKKFNIPNESLVFVYLGYLGKGRSIEEISNIFASSEVKSHLVFVGYGELVEYIKEKQNQNENIHLHDAIAHDMIVEILKNADVGFCLIENVSLSDYFCLPNKLFEYTFAGVPIIASDFPDIKQVVSAYNLGAICSLDNKSILGAVKEFELNPPGRLNADLYELGWEFQAKKLRNTYFEMENRQI